MESPEEELAKDIEDFLERLIPSVVRKFLRLNTREISLRISAMLRTYVERRINDKNFERRRTP